MKEAGLKREDIFVTTKLAPISARPVNVKPAFERSLELLDIGYVDLYLLHWPVALSPVSGELIPLRPDGTRDIDEELNGRFELTWAAMEELMETGKVKAIGVSNFSIHNLERLLASAKIVPAVNQIEGHRKVFIDFIMLIIFLKKRLIFFFPFISFYFLFLLLI